MQEKRILKEEKLAQEEKYMWAVLDGVREKVVFHFVDRNLFLASQEFADHKFTTNAGWKFQS